MTNADPKLLGRNGYWPKVHPVDMTHAYDLAHSHRLGEQKGDSIIHSILGEGKCRPLPPPSEGVKDFLVLDKIVGGSDDLREGLGEGVVSRKKENGP